MSPHNPIPSIAVPMVILLLCSAGCATGPQTQLTVGGANSPAVFEYRDVFWRPAPSVQGGVEVVGYGFAAFYNDPISRNYDPRWSTTGRVVIRLHGASQPDGTFTLTLLGPSMTLGPGDDELITGIARSVQTEHGEKDALTVNVPATSVTSRNRPGEALNLSGTIFARRTDDRTFDRQVKQFNTERGYRDLPHATKPGGR